MREEREDTYVSSDRIRCPRRDLVVADEEEEVAGAIVVVDGEDDGLVICDDDADGVGCGAPLKMADDRGSKR